MELKRGNVGAPVSAMRKVVQTSLDDPELRKMLDELVAYERSRNCEELPRARDVFLISLARRPDDRASGYRW